MMNDVRQSSVKVRRSAFVVLIIAMLLFTAWFSLYSISLHDAHLTHKADLGQIDLAIWNTAHGRLLQEIKDETISTRLTDHVEPIFVPLSLVFWFWDDVRALLILQALALAAGAWPIYLLARKRMANGDAQPATRSTQDAARKTQHAMAFADWGALVFAGAYLLAPTLQAGAVAEFHALPFAVPLIAWALWCVEDQRWIQFAVASLLLASVQEGMALLTMTLGIYAVARSLNAAVGRSQDELRSSQDIGSGSLRPEIQQARFGGPIAGIIVFLIGLAWFYVATFVIIPHYAAQAYGVSQTPYAARFGELGDTFGDVLKSLVFRPGQVLRIVVEPLRLRYLAGLLWPTAFLALLGPEIVLLALPLLLANLLSGYAFQYSGELHYSAPLIPYFVIAAIFGFGRLIRNTGLFQKGLVLNRRRVSGRVLLLAAITLCAVGYQVASGYLPIGLEFWRRVPGGWPAVTDHQRLLARFTAQIPTNAPLSVATDLYPHLSHRELVYQFPMLGQAEWALIDVTGTTDRHPADVQASIRKLLASGWGVADAADGYILLGQGRGTAVIPDAFYDFARSKAPRPQHSLDVTFGDRLKLVGYDVVDEVKWRSTSLRYYWQVTAPLPPNIAISVQILTPDSAVADDTAVRPMPALLWYAPSRWQPGEILVTQTIPWYLPRDWAPVVTINTMLPALPQGQSTSSAAGTQGEQVRESVQIAEGRVRLPPWTRRDGRLMQLQNPDDPLQVEARFAARGWAVRLKAWAAPMAIGPGKNLPVIVQWQAGGAAPKDYTIFVHIRDMAGKTIATGDSTPAWFLSLPTSTWSNSGVTTWDAHSITVPSGAPAGRYDLVLGWYDWTTGERLRLTDDVGNVLADEFVLGPLTIASASGPRPDLACLLAAESCASLE